MKLFKTEIESGTYGADKKTIYVVALDYAGAEFILLSQANENNWAWNFDRRISEIEELKAPVILGELVRRENRSS